VLVEEGSLLVWGTSGVPFRGGPLLLQVGELGNYDRCRTHAEQQAITLGPARQIAGGGCPDRKLIYVRLEADDSVQLEMPHFCPRCSRLALSLGVAEWIVALPDSLVGYSSADYDAIAQLRR
jgi:hypothetical protein